MIKFLDIAGQYESIKPEIDDAISSVIKESAFIGGRFVRQFEEDFAAYQQVKDCVGVANGTDAIEVAIEALGLPKGSEVIVPANSFIASSEAVTRSGHRVVFCDCAPETYTLSADDARKRITANTRAIIAVHLYGHPCDMDGLLDLGKRHGLKIIEDCAQAHGAQYKGRRVGGIGDVGTFSFYPGKNLGAYGDGGAIVTNDEALAKKCRMIANHGRTAKYNHELEGRNSRLDGLQAAILGVKLRHLDGWTARRRVVAGLYNEYLKDMPEIKLPMQMDWATHVWHLFVIRVKDRDGLRRHLTDMGIQTGVHYPVSLPKLRAYSYLGQGDEPMLANRFDAELLSLPMGEHVKEQEIEGVVEGIGYFLGSRGEAGVGTKTLGGEF
jgi:dTDP-4-amino-4,6-dideoxygalactose transaminase